MLAGLVREEWWGWIAVPFIADDLLEAVDHAGVAILAWHGDVALDLSRHLLIPSCPSQWLVVIIHSRFDNIERIHD